ncbi:MAG: 30S ribosomal protein S8 [Candidatus Izimaplasma sp.]|nr:30S ribosomal protein S8 [Candidatus Izimaplasma bacterium]
MVMTDPIADMLSRIENACRMSKKTVDVPKSNIKRDIVEVLKKEGYIKGFKEIDKDVQGLIRIELKYVNENRAIKGLKRISKPGLRVYAKTNEIPKVLNGLGIAVVSTSNGVLTDREARKQRVGGEILAYVW